MRRSWLALLAFTPLAATAQQIVGLGHLPGAPTDNPYSAAFAVSADGSTVVGESDSQADANASTYELQAFRWTRSGGMQGLGDLPGGGFDSVANGVSADGSVIVGGSIGSGAEFKAFRWTQAGGMVQLPGDNPGAANGVTADGVQVVGIHEANDGDANAVIWSPNGMGGYAAPLILNDLPGGVRNNLAWGVSADGSVIVGYSSSANSGSNAVEATRWDAAGVATPLGDLSGGGLDSDARAVSADGSVIAGFGRTSAGYLATRWTQAGGPVSLGELPGGEVYSEAYAISADGTTIVGDSSAAGATAGEVHAFVWDAVNGMRDLHELVDAEGQGWLLYAASGVSADGTIIVGEGRNPDGDREAYLVDLPEPGASLAALAAVVALAGIRASRP